MKGGGEEGGRSIGRSKNDALSSKAQRLAAIPRVVQFIYGCHLGSIVVVQRYALYTRIVAGSRVRLQF